MTRMVEHNIRSRNTRNERLRWGQYERLKSIAKHTATTPQSYQRRLRRIADQLEV